MNLIWDRTSKTPKLCDFDSYNECGSPQLKMGCLNGSPNPGTWIFMAGELLDHDAMAGEVTRVYRHEVEAFIAVLIWIICRYQGGKLRGGNPLGHWIQTSYLECSAKRRRTFNQIAGGTFPQPAGVPGDLWGCLRLSLNEMRDHSEDIGRAERRQQNLEYLRSVDPNVATDAKSTDDYNALRALPKILAWPIFKNEAAQKFIGLVEERILKPLGLKL